MKKYIIVFVFTTVLTGVASAGTHFVRPGAAGNNSGADWINAWTSIPANMTRGDTYYIADGSYGSVTFDTAESGSTYIYVKKASPSDHGTDIGWNNSYGDGSAAFTSINIQTDYWNIDGTYGKWASNLPNYFAYGFTVKRTINAGAAKQINIGNSSNPTSHIYLSHIEASFTNTPKVSGNWSTNMDIIYGYGGDWHLSYLWIHDAGRAPIYPVHCNGFYLDHSVIERNGQGTVAENWSSSEHSELIALRDNNGIISNNVFRDWRSTGGVMFMSSTGYPGCSNYQVFGNVFVQTGYWGASPGGSNGSITGDSSAINSNISIINNTFVNLYYTANVMTMGTNSSVTVKNNVFVNCYHSASSFDVRGSTQDYNFYYNVGGTETETHKQIGTASPLVNPLVGDFRLAHPTNVGDSSVGGIYNTDPNGNPRGADGVWDRGAYEYAGNNEKIPVYPSISIQ